MAEESNDKAATNNNEKYQKMIDEFEATRNTHSATIREVSLAFKSTQKLVNAEHQLYHVRQDLVDYKHKLGATLSELNKDYKQLKKNRMIQHKENKVAFVPANPTDKKILDESFFSKVVAVIEAFDHQFSWCNESIKTCDQIANGLSYHIKLVNILGGGRT